VIRPNDAITLDSTRTDRHLDRASGHLRCQRVASLSPRLKAIVDVLPLRAGIRVIEIGCGPGAAGREIVERVGASGHVLAVARSAKAIALLTESAAAVISAEG
jgi:SAM-dependent methyltransferase